MGLRDFNTLYIWKLTIPVNVKIFMWLVLEKRFLSVDNLVKRRWVVEQDCVSVMSRISSPLARSIIHSRKWAERWNGFRQWPSSIGSKTRSNDSADEGSIQLTSNALLRYRLGWNKLSDFDIAQKKRSKFIQLYLSRPEVPLDLKFHTEVPKKNFFFWKLWPYSMLDPPQI